MAKKKSESKEKTKLDKKDIEEIILKQAKQGVSATLIGDSLRKTYGVSSVKSHGIKIKKLLSEKGVKEDMPDDFKNLLARAEELKKHCNSNKQDKTAERGLQIIAARIRKKAHYLKRKSILPKDWQY